MAFHKVASNEAEELKRFLREHASDSSREQWDRLSDQQRRTVLASQTEGEGEALAAALAGPDPSLLSQVELLKRLDDLPAQAEYATQMARLAGEIADHVAKASRLLVTHRRQRIADLPFLARREIEADAERLFGAKSFDVFTARRAARSTRRAPRASR